MYRIKNICLLCFLAIFLISTGMEAQNAHELRKFGDENYLENEFQSAEIQYRKSLEKEKSLNGTYNLGNSVYNQARFAEASDYYNNALGYAEDDETKSKIYYNLGNAFLKEQKFQESIEAYKNSLKLNPSDRDAKQNLFLAKQMKKKQEQEQQQEKQENKNEEQQDQQNQNQQQDQQPQDQQEENNQESDSSEQQQQEQQQNDQQAQAGEKEGLNKEDAAKLLQVIENEDKKVQEKLRKLSANKKKVEKDW